MIGKGSEEVRSRPVTERANRKALGILKLPEPLTK
jgi:hypothetical protein